MVLRKEVFFLPLSFCSQGDMLHSGQQRGRDVEGPGLSLQGLRSWVLRLPRVRLSRVSGVGCPSPASQRVALWFAWPFVIPTKYLVFSVPGTVLCGISESL